MTTPSVSLGVAARNASAAERLFERYRQPLYRFCMARLRSREEAEDAVQNVFLRVHMALGRGVVPRFEAAWLYKIAHNVCLSKHEATARRARVETPEPFDDDSSFAAPEAHHDELAGLSEALDAMPANLRRAILLREWQGLSYAEIAEAMGLTVPAVETLLFRARRHLAASLEQGPQRQPRALSRLLDFFALRGLAGRIRELLAGAAPAKLAAGVALVAIGGGAVDLAVTQATQGARPVHVVPAAFTPPAQAPAIAPVRVARAVPALTPAAATPRTTSSRPALVVHSGVSQKPVPAPAASVPESVTAPMAATSSEPVLVPPATPIPLPTDPPIAVPAPPTVEPPAVEVPAVTVPAVDVPTVDTGVAPPAVADPLPGGVGGLVTVP